MADRPILFSGPMVRALLKGRKTQTRRVVKPQPSTHHWQKSPGYIGDYRHEGDNLWHFAHRIPQNKTWDCDRQIKCPYGKPGDLLWVRETFRGAAGYDESPPSRWGNKPIWYAADGEPDPKKWWHLAHRSRPGIHMPRWASRLTLRITDVRVQRLQDCSHSDAVAEGLDHVSDGCAPWGIKGLAGSWGGDPRRSYAALWESINGTGSWNANPWVWALTFEVIPRNVDAVLLELANAPEPKR